MTRNGQKKSQKSLVLCPCNPLIGSQTCYITSWLTKEVDLGIDEKIRNIEATEFAKKRLAEERNKKNKLIGKNRKHFIKDVSWYLCFIYFDLKKCKYSFHEIFRTVILVIMYCFILWEPLVLLIFRRGHNTTVLKLNSLSFINHQIKDPYHYKIKYE